MTSALYSLGYHTSNWGAPAAAVEVEICVWLFVGWWMDGWGCVRVSVDISPPIDTAPFLPPIIHPPIHLHTHEHKKPPHTHLHCHVGLHSPARVGLDGDVAPLGRLHHPPLGELDRAEAVQLLRAVAFFWVLGELGREGGGDLCVCRESVCTYMQPSRVCGNMVQYLYKQAPIH